MGVKAFFDVVSCAFAQRLPSDGIVQQSLLDSLSAGLPLSGVATFKNFFLEDGLPGIVAFKRDFL